MWYLIFVLFAVWVLFDARKRKNNFAAWSVGTVLLGPIVLPIYFAKRNLKDGETREGGTGWNVLKNFALFWTLTMGVAAIAGMVNVGKHATTLSTNAEKAGAAIGTAIGLGLLGIIWFVPIFFALVIGFFIKKSSIVEKGPTGQLAG